MNSIWKTNHNLVICNYLEFLVCGFQGNEQKQENTIKKTLKWLLKACHTHPRHWKSKWSFWKTPKLFDAVYFSVLCNVLIFSKNHNKNSFKYHLA